MERRKFLESCAALSSVAGIGALPHAWASTPPRFYERTRLVDRHGAPVKAATLEAETNYVIHYPYAGTPCFLLRLARPVAAASTLRRGWHNVRLGRRRRPDARWSPLGDLRAPARLPTPRDISFIRYQPQKSGPPTRT
jgi:hypothetical protein